MKPLITIFWRMVLLASLGNLANGAGEVHAQPANRGQDANEVHLVLIQQEVEIMAAGSTRWIRIATTNQAPLGTGDRLRTGPSSRAVLRWSDQMIVTLDARTEVEIRPTSQAGLQLIRGIFSFFHRDKPRAIQVIGGGTFAGIKGTEFVMEVAEVVGRERTTLSVIDGEVEFGNAQGTLTLTNLQQAVAEAGQAPLRTAGFIVNNLLQWCFYYPAVLDLKELPLTTGEQAALGESLAAYRQGELLAALANYPQARPVRSDAERVYHAALLLAVGQVEQCETQLASLGTVEPLERQQRLAGALRLLIAAVKREPRPSTLNAQIPTATELLAASYYEQSLAGPEALKAALELARRAVELSPEFGFGWERVAELEFSFGRTGRALVALDRSLALTPRNAQALGLKGFLLAAQNQTHAAIGWFDQALAVDGALGNAWLGRGLCRIRRGDLRGGREDLLVAAAVEPRRAALRSYLGKAWSETGDDAHAQKELTLARRLDPNDPTSWLYSALNHEQHNRLNEAIRDLEKSQELNHNRSVYRSGLLLDQDRAVRSANLAKIYREAGMEDVALREASRAVAADYGNYSAHLFLANSFNELRDPNLINLRYETSAASEYLLANLLAPVGAGTLSPTISQQEYSKLFERDRFGIISSTEYLSRGAWTQSGSQYGTKGNFSYGLEAFYRADPGERVNNDLEQRQLSLAVKQQLTLKDSLYFQVQHFESTSGDVAQYYDPTNANRRVRITETQEPIVSLGYHREWQPGVHTLVLASRLSDRFVQENPRAPAYVVFKPFGDIVDVHGITLEQKYGGDLEIYAIEAQQIWEHLSHTTIVGGRFQYGHIDASNFQDKPSSDGGVFPTPPVPAAQQDIHSAFQRFSIYGYHQWQVGEYLRLIGGFAYENLKFPENFRNAPLSGDAARLHQFLPKAGLIFTPTHHSTVRFAYSQSVAGASLDQSVQIEPSQIAGFVQSFRSLIPESVIGATAGAKFETLGISLEQKLPTDTYLGLSAELLRSKFDRTVGAFDVKLTSLFAEPSGLNENLDFSERSVTATVNQLAGKTWAFGARYRLTQASLHDHFTEIADAITPTDFVIRRHMESLLHHAQIYALYHNQCGFFAQGVVQWYRQSNTEYLAREPGDDFWHLDIYAGYRFPHRQAELAVGLLNVTDRDYRLEPLTPHNSPPRTRTLSLRLTMNF